MPRLLWHGASVCNGHLIRGAVTLTLIAERLAVELSLPVFTTWVSRDWDSNTRLSAFGVNAPIDCATAAAYTLCKKLATSDLLSPSSFATWETSLKSLNIYSIITQSFNLQDQNLKELDTPVVFVANVMIIESILYRYTYILS